MSAVEPRRVAEKAGYVRRELAFLRTLPPNITDPSGIRAARYSVQTAVTALTDLAYHLCAKKLHHPPQNARDAFRRLQGAGAIPDAMMRTISAMIGFRNLAVHGYESFDDDELRKVLRDDLPDLESVLVALEHFAAGA